jgi:hypothetical protein
VVVGFEAQPGVRIPPSPLKKPVPKAWAFFIRHSILSGRNKMIFYVATSTGFDWLKT